MFRGSAYWHLVPLLVAESPSPSEHTPAIHGHERYLHACAPTVRNQDNGRSENARASAHAPQDYKYIKGSLVSTSAQVGGRRLGCRSGAGCSGGRVCEACWLSRHLRGSVAGKPALRSPFCAQIQRFGGITVPWPGGLSAESGCKSG